MPEVQFFKSQSTDFFESPLKITKLSKLLAFFVWGWAHVLTCMLENDVYC